MGCRKWSDDELIVAVKVNNSIRSICIYLGLSSTGGASKTIKKRIKELGLDTSHFYRMNSWHKSTKYNVPLETILVKRSRYLNTNHLKQRLIKVGLLKNICYICSLSSMWNKLPLSLQLDHIDGDRTNNELSNLRILCPNCHSQTLTYGSKKRK